MKSHEPQPAHAGRHDDHRADPEPVHPAADQPAGQSHWPTEIQSIITIALGTATGFFTEWADAGTTFDWKTALGLSLGSLLIAIAARYGFWRETPLDAKLLSVGSKPDVVTSPIVTPVVPAPESSAPEGEH